MRALLLLSLPLALLSTLPEPGASAEELVVAADASLGDVFRVVGESFEKASPGVQVVFNFASAEDYLTQIRRGQTPDVLVSANPREVSALTRQGAYDVSTRRQIATNRLVLIAPLDAGPTTLMSLSDASVKRVAIGDPKTVAGGAYAVESLKALGLLAAVEPKMTLGQSVRQVLELVEAGGADAGFVFGTDAASSKAVRVVAAIPDSLHMPIVYVVVAASGGPHMESARRFIDFVAGPEGQQALFERGFGVPPALPPASAPPKR